MLTYMTDFYSGKKTPVFKAAVIASMEKKKKINESEMNKRFSLSCS